MGLLLALLVGCLAGYTVGETVKVYGKKNNWSLLRMFVLTCILSVIVGLTLAKLI